MTGDQEERLPQGVAAWIPFRQRVDTGRGDPGDDLVRPVPRGRVWSSPEAAVRFGPSCSDPAVQQPAVNQVLPAAGTPAARPALAAVPSAPNPVDPAPPAAPEPGTAVAGPVTAEVVAATTPPSDVPTTQLGEPVGPRAERPVLSRRTATASAPWCDPDRRSAELGARPSMAAAAPWKPARASSYTPDTVLDACQVEALELRMASTRGPGHRVNGEPREDDGALAVTPDGRFALLLVADGLGSVPGSHDAAHRAVRAAVEYCLDELPVADLAGLDAQRLFRDVTRELDRRSLWATTLTVGIVEVRPEPERPRRFRVLRVGDSPAYVLGDGAFRAVFDDDKGDGALHGTATAALPSPHPAVQEGGGELAPGEALVVATDGLGEPLRAEPVQAHLATAWSSPPGPGEFLQHLQFRVRSYDDDRSAAVAWVTGGPS